MGGRGGDGRGHRGGAGWGQGKGGQRSFLRSLTGGKKPNTIAGNSCQDDGDERDADSPAIVGVTQHAQDLSSLDDNTSKRPWQVG